MPQTTEPQAPPQQQPAPQDQQQQPLQEKKPVLSHRVKWVIIPLVLIALGVGGFLYWSYASVRESTDDAQVDGHIYPVSAMIDGTVTQVLVDNNQFVQAGTVLARIDPRIYQAAVDKAQSDVDAAVAVEKESRTAVPIASTTTTTQLSGAEAGVGEQEARIETAQRGVDAANVRLTTAQANQRQVQANTVKTAADLERMKPLAAKQEISQQQYDAYVAADNAAKAALDSAQSQVQEAREGILSAQTILSQERARMVEVRSRVAAAQTGPQQVEATRARAESATANVEQKQAALKQAKVYLDYTTIVAPISGIVSQRSMEVGQTVSHGQNMVAIVPVDDLWVTANFKESQLEHIRPGQPATIEVDAYGGRKYKGHVDSIGAATGARFSLLPPENATGNYVKVVQRIPVKIFFDKGENSDHLLRPGMSVTPTVLTN